MGNAYSAMSRARLSECDPRLQMLFHLALPIMDHTIVEGFRNKERQERMFREGKSKVRWPDSMHNKQPAHAVDVAPYPIDWHDRERFFYFAGIIDGISSLCGLKIRWGGDWNRNRIFYDQSFDDLGHFELVGG